MYFNKVGNESLAINLKSYKKYIFIFVIVILHE